MLFLMERLGLSGSVLQEVQDIPHTPHTTTARSQTGVPPQPNPLQCCDRRATASSVCQPGRVLYCRIQHQHLSVCERRLRHCLQQDGSTGHIQPRHCCHQDRQGIPHTPHTPMVRSQTGLPPQPNPLQCCDRRASASSVCQPGRVLYCRIQHQHLCVCERRLRHCLQQDGNAEPTGPVCRVRGLV